MMTKLAFYFCTVNWQPVILLLNKTFFLSFISSYTHQQFHALAYKTVKDLSLEPQ